MGADNNQHCEKETHVQFHQGYESFPSFYEQPQKEDHASRAGRLGWRKN